jgi:glycosyltransferase involved in cell wall biosynthesis
VGDGEMRTLLEKFVLEGSLGTYVEFMGFRSKEEILGEILPSTDIFVNPSLQE